MEEQQIPLPCTPPLIRKPLKMAKETITTDSGKKQSSKTDSSSSYLSSSSALPNTADTDTNAEISSSKIINNKNRIKSKAKASDSSSNSIDAGTFEEDTTTTTTTDDHGCSEDGRDVEEGPGVADAEDAECECVQCEVCLAENWWRMAAFHGTLVQQDQDDLQGFEIPESSANGLDLISSAATLMLSQQQQAASNSNGCMATSSDDVLRADFSMPKLREFFECQKQMGIPNFPEEFDEFWLLVVKARLFNIFKYRGPEAYNRIVMKIRNIARQFRLEMEVRERQEIATAEMRAIITGAKEIPSLTKTNKKLEKAVVENEGDNTGSKQQKS